MNALTDSTWVLNSETIKILASAATSMTAKQKLHTPALPAIIAHSNYAQSYVRKTIHRTFSANDTQKLTTWQSHIHI